MASKLKIRKKELTSKKFLTPEEMEELSELEKKLQAYSKRGRSNKRKGSNYEREVSKVLEDKLNVEFKRTPQSGGFSKSSNMGEFKGDIICTDPEVSFVLHSECKDQKNWQLKKWYEQAQEEVTDDKIPAVIMKKHNTKNPGQKGNQQDLITLDLKDFLEIVDVDKLLRRK